MTVPSRSDRRTAQGTRFPRLAQSGHEDDAKRCLLSKVKRTSGKVAAMSGNDPKRTLDLQDILSAVIQHNLADVSTYPVQRFFRKAVQAIARGCP